MSIDKIPVRIKLNNDGEITNFLEFVKSVKYYTGLSLKEAKDRCDRIKNYREKYTEFYINVNDKLKFHNEISNILKGFICNLDPAISREAKILEVGFFKKIEYSEFILKFLKENLMEDSNIILHEILSKMDDKSLIEIISLIRKHNES